MNPIRQREIQPGNNVAGYSQKERNLKAPESRFVPSAQMQGVATSNHLSKPPLRVAIPESHTFDLPSLVEVLDQSLKRALVAHQGSNASSSFSLQTDLNPDEITAKIQQAYRADCAHLRQFITTSDLISDVRKSHTKLLLEDNSPFIEYGEIMALFGHKALPTVTHIINTIRHINREVQQLNASELDEALKQYPLKVADLKCFDGTVTRLESILTDIKNAQIAAGSRTPTSILQHLDRSSPCQLQLLNDVIDETIIRSRMNNFIHPELEIHQSLGFQCRLGISATATEQKDGFARVAVQHIPGPLFYNGIVKFQDTLRQKLNEQLQTQEINQSLDEFQNQLLSTVISNQQPTNELQTDQTTDKATALPLLGAQLAEIKKSQIGHLLREKDTGIEQLYGIWNDDITEIQDWDWSSIEDKLKERINDEWALTQQEIELIKLEGLTYKEINNLHPSEVLKSLTGSRSSQEQYLAIHYLLALLDNSTPHTSRLAQNRRKLLFFISHMVPLTQGLHERPFLVFANAALNNCILKSNSTVNRRMLHKLGLKIDQTYSPRYPYANTSLMSIVGSYIKARSNAPMSINEYTLLFDLEMSQEKYRSIAQNLILWDDSTAPLALMPFMQYATKTLDPKAADFLRIMTESKPSLLIEVLLNTIEASDLTRKTRSFGAHYFLTSGFGKYFPELISENRLHQKHYKLAEIMVLKALHSMKPALIERLLMSAQAKSNLHQTLFPTPFSFYSVCEQYNVAGKNKKLFELMKHALWLSPML